jgi:hypothetical protein
MFRPLLAIIRRRSQHYKEILHMFYILLLNTLHLMNLTTHLCIKKCKAQDVSRKNS